MICPHCGAQIRDFLPSCQMCGNEIDREKLFKTYFDKGSAAFEAGNFDSAAVNIKKALEFRQDSAAHVKLGIAYQKKGLRSQAASEYVKAIAADYTNENAHNMLVNIYVSQARHAEIKAWYEKNMAPGREEITGKMIRIIDTSRKFMEENPGAAIKEISVSPSSAKIGGMLIKYLKRYALINAVLFVGLVLIGIAVMLSTVFKTDPVILLGATAFFFLAAAVMFFVIRARKKKEKTKGTETELLSELKAMAGENDLSDKRL